MRYRGSSGISTVAWSFVWVTREQFAPGASRESCTCRLCFGLGSVW